MLKVFSQIRLPINTVIFLTKVPCPDMTKAVERDVKPQTFHFISVSTIRGRLFRSERVKDFIFWLLTKTVAHVCLPCQISLFGLCEPGCLQSVRLNCLLAESCGGLTSRSLSVLDCSHDVSLCQTYDKEKVCVVF